LFRLTGQRSRSFEGHCLCQGHTNMSSVGGCSVLCSYDWSKLFKLVKLLEEISMMINKKLIITERVLRYRWVI